MRFALSAKVWTNTYICWIGIDTLKSSKSPERDSNPGRPRDYDRVQRADHAATLPPYYIYILFSSNNAKLAFAQIKHAIFFRYFIYLGA